MSPVKSGNPLHGTTRRLATFSAMPISRLLRHSQYTITVGFVLVLILMAAIAVIGLTRMAAINERMNVIVSQHNVKTDLVAAMRNAARERSISHASHGADERRL